MEHLYYLHGRDSGPQGYRAGLLRKRYPHIKIPQLPNDVQERERLLAEIVEGPAYLIGNSLGGLSALVFVRDFPERVKAMVLTAPAVGFFDPQYRKPEILDQLERLVIPAAIPTTVIAATQDEIIPLEAIEALIKRSPNAAAIPFYKFEDDHYLHHEASLQAMFDAVDAMLKPYHSHA